MQELLKIRDRIQGEYEDAVGTVRDWREADGLLIALRIVEERIHEICEEFEVYRKKEA